MTAAQIRKRLTWQGIRLFLGELQVGSITFMGPFCFGNYSYGRAGIGNGSDQKEIMKLVEDAVVKSILTKLDE